MINAVLNVAQGIVGAQRKMSNPSRGPIKVGGGIGRGSMGWVLKDK